MIRAFFDWLDHRTGYRSVVRAMLLEHIPGGAKWRYVWGSALAFVFAVQLLTGLLLMTAYSPSASSAWGSVYFIQYEMDFGWLIRGLHHFGSQAMVVLLALHMLQVVIAGAHLPPREINWWLGLALMGLVLGMGLTGYLLPWDQKGYFATRVATNIAEQVPVIGPFMQRMLVGGPEYGNATVTRFFALHVAILPALIIALVAAHIWVFRRHGVTHPKNAKGEGWFWPDQAFRDLVVGLVIFGILLALVLNGHAVAPEGHGFWSDSSQLWSYEHWAKAGRFGLGANLDAPAEPSSEYLARPEWYFLFLFQLLKYFEGDLFLVGAVLIPGGVGLVLFLLPLLGYGKLRPIGHAFGVVFVTAVLTGVVALTCLALAADTADEVPRALLTRIGLGVAPLVAVAMLVFLFLLSVLPSGGLRGVVSFVAMAVMTVLVLGTGMLTYAALANQVPPTIAEIIEKDIAKRERATPEAAARFEADLAKAQDFQQRRAQNTREAEQAIRQAARGIPVEGAVMLLRRDPQTQFKRLFLKNCASCHSYGEFSKAEWKTTEEDAYRRLLDTPSHGVGPASLLGLSAPSGFGTYMGVVAAAHPDPFVASDLAGFGTAEWLHGFLLDPEHPRYYGRSVDNEGFPYFRRMKKWVDRQFRRKSEEEQAKIRGDFQIIAEWLATHPEGAKARKHPGFKLFAEVYSCIDCHRYEDLNPEGDAPDLTGYGSTAWLTRFLHGPGDPRFYGGKNLMPAFRDTKRDIWPVERDAYRSYLESLYKEDYPGFQVTFTDLSEVERALLARFLAGDHRVVFGGEPISGPP